MKHLIILMIDADTHRAEEPDGIALTPEALEAQGSFVNDDAAGILGYEAWLTVYDAADDLLEGIVQASSGDERS